MQRNYEHQKEQYSSLLPPLTRESGDVTDGYVGAAAVESMLHGGRCWCTACPLSGGIERSLPVNLFAIDDRDLSSIRRSILVYLAAIFFLYRTEAKLKLPESLFEVDNRVFDLTQTALILAAVLTYLLIRLILAARIASVDFETARIELQKQRGVDLRLLKADLEQALPVLKRDAATTPDIDVEIIAKATHEGYKTLHACIEECQQLLTDPQFAEQAAKIKDKEATLKGLNSNYAELNSRYNFYHDETPMIGDTYEHLGRLRNRLRASEKFLEQLSAYSEKDAAAIERSVETMRIRFWVFDVGLPAAVAFGCIFFLLGLHFDLLPIAEALKECWQTFLSWFMTDNPAQ